MIKLDPKVFGSKPKFEADCDQCYKHVIMVICSTEKVFHCDLSGIIDSLIDMATD